MEHAFDGLRSFTTAQLLALLDRAVEVLRVDQRVLAAWLVGSFVSGEADAFEALTGDGWKDVLARIMPAVMATSYPPAPHMAGGYAISPEWRHIDLAFWRRSAMPQALRSGHGFRALFDSAGVLPARAAERQPPAGEPYFPAAVVDLYFYLLGNLVTVLARGELLVATNGTIARRDNGLVPLLLAERGVHVMGGRKRLNPYLTAEQRELLESLPPIRCDVDSILACEAAMARVFIARGRALAHQVGAPWPAAFEQATVAHVQAALGVSLMH